MPPLVQDLFTFVSSVSSMWEVWELGPPAEAVELQAAEAAIEAAKSAIHVIGAVNVIEEYGGQPALARSMASKLLHAAGALPPILKDKLRQLAKQI